MRFLIIPRETPVPASEAGSCDPRQEDFDEELIRAYMRYNEELTRAGVLVAAEGLNPDVKAVHIGVANGKRKVMDGPFAETKELVGGFYLLDVASREEAVAWALKCPVGRGHEVLEIRQLTELGDLPAPFQEMITESAPAWSAARWPGK
jgi:hypothetical protein